MPRKPKTMRGAPAQPNEPVVGQTYGKAVEQTQLNQAMPIPDMTTPPPTAPVAGTALAGPARGNEPTPPPTFDTVLAQAAALRGKAGVLNTPTLYPDEPMTAGLTRGPGPGPEALGLLGDARSPGRAFMEELSVRSGNPRYAMLAKRAKI